MRLCLVEKESLLRVVVENVEPTATEKLEQFPFTAMYYVYHHFNEAPKLREAMYVQRPDMVEKYQASKQQLLTALLDEVYQPGQF